MVARGDHAAADSLAGERVGEMFELIVDDLAGLHDGVVKRRNRRARQDDSHDALEVALDVVAELGDLLIAVSLRQEEIMEFGADVGVGIIVAATGFAGRFAGRERIVRVDIDLGELGSDSGQGTERDNAVFGGRIAIGVDLE